jgi:hypothetical protein
MLPARGPAVGLAPSRVRIRVSSGTPKPDGANWWSGG